MRIHDPNRQLPEEEVAPEQQATVGDRVANVFGAVLGLNLFVLLVGGVLYLNALLIKSIVELLR